MPVHAQAYYLDYQVGSLLLTLPECPLIVLILAPNLHGFDLCVHGRYVHDASAMLNATVLLLLQNRRPDYLSTVVEELLNWDFASKNFAG
jgi:hypothetical protein